MNNTNYTKIADSKSIVIQKILDITNQLENAINKTKEIKKKRQRFKSDFFGDRGIELNDIKKKIAYYRDSIDKFKVQINSVFNLQK